METNLIQFTGSQSEPRMTSLQIAEIVGKPHNDLMKSIRKMEPAWEKLHQGKFSQVFRDVPGGNGAMRQMPCYELTKLECLYIATKFSDEARAAIILRWDQLESERKQSMPQTFAQALYLAAQQQEQIEIQQKMICEKNLQLAHMSDQINEMERKVTYYDTILASKATVTTTQIAQDYGMSAKAMNKILSNEGIQFKQNGQWILYAKYKSFGYVHSHPVEITRSNGQPDIIYNTEWTQKGRLFLYDYLKNIGVIPMIEQ